MKKLLLIAFLGLFTFNSCSDDNDNSRPLSNQLEFDGARYDITGVVETYYGDRYEDGTDNFELRFSLPGGAVLNLELITRDAESIPSGSYYLNMEGYQNGVGTLAGGTFRSGTDYHEILSGTLEISASTTHKISFVGTDHAGKKIELVYVGDVVYKDESPAAPVNQVMIGETLYEIDEISQNYWGYEYGNDVINVDLVVTFGGKYQFIIEALVPDGEVGLVDGNYKQDYSYKPYTLGIADSNGFGELEISRFSVTVDQDSYSLDIEGRTESNETLKCLYKGELRTIYQVALPSGTGSVSYMGNKVSLRYCEFDYMGSPENEWPVNALLVFANIDWSAEFYIDMWFPAGSFAGNYTFEEWDDGEIGPAPYTIEAGEGYADDEDAGLEFYVDFEDGEMTIIAEGDIYTIIGTFLTDEDEELEIYYKGKIYGIEEMENFSANPTTAKNSIKAPRKAIKRK